MRKILLFLVVFASWGLAGASRADTPDRVLGKPDAPITIIEYASLTCPHCAAFNKDILPELKTRYVDTGKAKLIYRDYPLDQWALKAAMLARCAPADKYFSFIDVLFQNQVTWATAKDQLAALERIGRLGGISAEQFNTCMQNRALEDAVLAESLRGQKEFDVQSTPTIIVNGKKVDNPLTFADFDKILKPLASQS
jgi:protein-disulfide isomerase